MDLLERKPYLDSLNGLYQQAAKGHGRMLLLGGEAGVGKTTIVQSFASGVQAPTRVLSGACEPLSAPRPHGLLSDMDEILQGQIGALLEKTASPVEIARAVLSMLSHGPPTVMILEDAHWIDEAAVDGIRYLGRRIGSAPLLVIITFRDDEIGMGHPLRRLLGDLATAPGVSRLHLPPLSLDAVTRMSEGTGIDPLEIFRLTNGNPFFISEVLASSADGLPATVRDAVLARADRLGPDARQLLEAVAIIGSPAESWLVTEVSRSLPESTEECMAKGLLVAQRDALAFRHELARMAVLGEVSPPRQIELHGRVLAALLAQGSHDLVRLTHHAAAAFDRDAVLEYGPAAARRAAAFRSHREAAAQYERVMAFAGTLPGARRAELLHAWSFEIYLTDQSELATGKCQEAIELWQAEGNTLRQGDALRWLSRLYWYAGRNPESETTLSEAIRILEELPPSAELAMAYSARSQSRMLAWDAPAAVEWGERAITLAEALGERETLAHALANVGAAFFLIGKVPEGVALVERSLAIAKEDGLEEDAARAYTLLSTGRCEMYAFADTDPWLDEGIAYCSERDIDTYTNYLSAWRGVSRLYQGQWPAAVEQANAVLRQERLAPISRIVALAVLGRVAVRTGDLPTRDLLDEALELAERTGELQRLCPVRTARAEAAWLAGDRERTQQEAASIYEMVLRSGHQWYIGQLAFWLWRAEALPEIPTGAFEPYVLQIEGNWRKAAAAWRVLGCPYEAAWALVDSNSEAELRYAYAEFARLGAHPAAAIVTQRLRALGAERLPRGPRASTQTNPFRLTGRELEVLALLVRGFRTQDIADSLFLSPRTVGHHITAILGKLQVHSREEAVRKALAFDIVSQSRRTVSPK
jgi:DNA-binding CsgD family transcriptional regulator/tetratricopeptide (TPR) repeat protein